MFLGFIAMMRWLSGGYHVPLLTPASQCFAAFRLVPTMLGSLVKPFGTPFRVTPKGLAVGQARIDRVTFGMALLFFLATILGIASHISPNGGLSDGFFPVVMFWSFWISLTWSAAQSIIRALATVDYNGERKNI